MQDFTLQPNMAPVSRPRRVHPALWGILLIAGGMLLLLETLGYFQHLSGFMVSLLFGAGGAVFLYFFLRDTQSTWWAAIPGFTLLGLAGTVFIDNYAPQQMAFLAGSSILAGIGVGFLAVYLSHREKWWALIPAGTMLSVAAVAAVSQMPGVPEEVAGGTMLMGLGLTFLIVALTGRADCVRRWAYVPAAVLFMIGVFLSASMDRALEAMAYVLPASLIAIGAWIVYVAMSRRES